MTRGDVAGAVPTVTTGLGLYDATAAAASSVVIRRYSTSFGLASRLLPAHVREHIEHVYALVRVADEIVDGPATEAGLDPTLAGRLLDELEQDTERAMTIGFSVNPVVHAFARTARTTGFGAELTQPFFRSMRADLTRSEHDDASFVDYVYGSAEVVGLMCLRAFVYRAGRPTFDEAVLVTGARRLGAAFQKVNFLRDLRADFLELGRSYFPGVDVRSFDEATKVRLVADVQDDLDAAARALPLLPGRARPAVTLAHALFQELNDRIAATPAERLVTTRVRVPDPVKAALAARVLVGRAPVPRVRRGNRPGGTA
ncbi:phytoene/squalene synthase family protein [Curtobacterium sp. MCBD17_019]|uniref:phytoene/squalene synthase family protein n=1 Tax=Curtobacterium sp. MCBD17_019 TaxID=2175669 RepID=UPI0021ACD4D4|nr:phytoene/squalene synthase family protein [Curtobacterium sp. MCBD17_019]